MKNYKLALLSTVLTSSIVLAAPVALAADGGIYGSNGAVNFVPNEDPTLPVDPENPDPTNPVEPVDPTDPNGPNPGTGGPLSIDFASSLHFGSNKITSADETYFADAQTFTGNLAGETRGNYVQITDNRGTAAGWTLRVAQGGQFKSETAKQYKELKGSVIKFTQGTPDSNGKASVAAPQAYDFNLNPDGSSSLVMTAANGAGSGTWVDYFGTSEAVTINQVTSQKNKAITLSVPGSTPKEAVEYRTVLTWTLTDVPGL